LYQHDVMEMLQPLPIQKGNCASCSIVILGKIFSEQPFEPSYQVFCKV
jgi:hypothetical protein